MESSLRDLKQKSALRKIPRDEWQETIAQDNLASLQAMQRGELPEYDLSPKYGLEERDLGFNEELGTQIFNDPDYQRAASETAEWLPVTGDIQAVEDASYLADAAKRNWREGEYLNALALGAGAEGLGALAALGGAATITPMLDPAVTAAQRGAGSWLRGFADDIVNRSVMDDLVPAGVPMRQLPMSQADDLGGEVLMSESRGALDRLGRQVYDEPLNMPSQATDLDAQGFYSPTRRAASRIQEKGTGTQMKAQLLKSGLSGERIGEEMQDIGLDKWLDSKGKVTRQEIVDYVDANRVGYDEITQSDKAIHDIRTKMTVDRTADEIELIMENDYQLAQQIDEIQPYVDRYRQSLGQDVEAREYLDSYFASAGYRGNSIDRHTQMLERKYMDNLAYENIAGSPKYKNYALEGGENYRENLMTIPQYGRIDVSSLSKAEFDEMGFLGAKMREKGNLPPEEMTRWRELKDRDNQYREAVNSADRGLYQSSHYSEPNIALTTRTQSFKTNDGQNVHLIDELQSDWHDEGRKKGYQVTSHDQIKADYKKALLNEGMESSAAENSMESMTIDEMRDGLTLGGFEGYRSDVVPDAPAKTAWKQQGLRRELTRAIQQGDDYIALTGGLEQAERYGLRKKVESVLYKQNADGTFRVSAQMPFGQPAKLIGQNISLDELGGIVGKEIAEKISDGSGVKRNLGGNFVSTPPDEWLELSGGDLEIGTEGKKKLYDKDFLGKLTKDVKRLDPNAKVEVIELNNGKKVWGIKITDTMRGKVKNSGMSLYSAAPVGAVGALGAIGASKENNEGI